MDSGELVRRCIKELKTIPAIPKLRVLSQTADIHIRREGVTHTEREVQTMDIED